MSKMLSVLDERIKFFLQKADYDIQFKVNKLLSEEDELWLKTADELVLDGPVLNLWLEDKDISIKSRFKPILDEITYLLSENDVLIHEEIERVVEVEIDRIINTGICENPDIMPFDFNKKMKLLKASTYLRRQSLSKISYIFMKKKGIPKLREKLSVEKWRILALIPNYRPIQKLLESEYTIKFLRECFSRKDEIITINSYLAARNLFRMNCLKDKDIKYLLE